jgi:hypothetical protein
MRDKEVDLSLREHLAPDIYDSICLNVTSVFIVRMQTSPATVKLMDKSLAA